MLDINHLENDKLGCRRCQGAVFKAEEVCSKGVLFHKKCATCLLCQRQLNLGNIYSGLGKDLEIYCKICFEGKYGDHSPGQDVGTRCIKAKDVKVGIY